MANLQAAFGVCNYIVTVALMSLTGVLGKSSNFSKLAKSGEFQGLFPALVVFGDSTVDAGNNNYLNSPVMSNFPPYGMNFPGRKSTGRFTDGLIAPDLLSLEVGIPLQLPYLSPEAHGEAILTGINFASSASGWLENTDNIWNVKGIAAQMKWYQNWKAEVVNVAGQEKGNYIIDNALYFISTGNNDWVNNYYFSSNLQKQYTTDQYTTLLLGLARKYIQELYTLGGRNIAIISLPPLGCLPEQITLNLGNEGCVKALNDVCSGFNDRFHGLVEDMKKTMPGSRLFIFDNYSLILNAFENPLQYGFKYARTGCCGTGDLEVSYLCNRFVPSCSNPDEHLFWDSFHPSSHFYRLLTDHFLVLAKPILLAPPTT